MSARLLSIEEVAALLDMSSRRVLDAYVTTGRLKQHRLFGKQGVKHGYSAIEVAELLNIETSLLDLPLLDTLLAQQRVVKAQEIAWAQLLQEQALVAAVRDQLIERDRISSHTELALKTQVSELESELYKTVEALNFAIQRADACEDTIACLGAGWSTKLEAAELEVERLYETRSQAYQEIDKAKAKADRYEVALAIVAIGALAAVLWWLP